MENLKHLQYKTIPQKKQTKKPPKKQTNKQTNRFIKIKNSVLELENPFIGLQDGELKDRKLNILKRNRRTIFETSYCVYRCYR